jgi:signal peptidase II
MPAPHKRLTWWNGLVFILIVAVIVALDQTSKEWIRTNVPVGGSLPECWRLTIVHAHNTGSAFGLFTNQAFLLSIVAIAGLFVVLSFFRYFSELGFAGGIALSLVFAGALGNLIDRLRLGGVTDFLYVRLWDTFYWPAFNVADSAISIGAVSLAIIAIVKLGSKNETGTKPKPETKDV